MIKEFNANLSIIESDGGAKEKEAADEFEMLMMLAEILDSAG